MRRTFSFAVTNTASSPTSDCPLFIDDPHLYWSQDLETSYHKLNLAGCKFGRPSDCLPYLGAYFNSNHPELTLPE